MTFGNPFGLALHDKQQRQVTSSVRQERGPQTKGVPRQGGQAQQVVEARAVKPQMETLSQAQSPAEQSDAALTALSPAVIQLLHAQVRRLSRPQLEALVMAYRQRFRMGEGASVAAAITQKQHHDWVEAYLVQVESQGQRLS